MKIERNIINSRFLRRVVEIIWPFGAFQKATDPHSAIENLERASGAATLWILGGILLEIVALFIFEQQWPERMIGIVANGAIGFGLIVEYLVVGRVIDATKEAERESNERIAKIDERAAQANERAEKLHRQNLELERAISPRFLELTAAKTALEPFSPHKVVLIADSDSEAKGLASNLSTVFRRAKWVVLRQELSDGLAEGVSIEYAHLFCGNDADAEKVKISQKAREAATAIATELERQGIEGKVLWVPPTSRLSLRRQEVADDTLVVRVGRKPTMYFLEQKIPALKEAHSRLKEAEKRFKEAQKKFTQYFNNPPTEG